MSSDRDAQALAASYGVRLSIEEIRALRPLLDDISLHWLFTGVPPEFVEKVKRAVGERKGEELFQYYLDSLK